jgi:hypothetical protein
MSKNYFLTLLFIGVAFLSTKAQKKEVTVSQKAGYENQVWYSLQNGEVGTAPKNVWDIAFESSGFGSSIHINAQNGVMLYKYKKDNEANGWNTVDTTGINNWTPLYNSDTTWSLGAFNISKDISNDFDLGWGTYSLITHTVTGDSLFIFKDSKGEYYKVFIESLASGTFTFKYSKLGVDNDKTVEVKKSDYNTKNFAYFNFDTEKVMDYEPVESKDWDLLFTQFFTYLFVPNPVPYNVTGILQNNGVQVAKASGISNASEYKDYSNHDFSSKINGIGWDWKSFRGSWIIEDSLVFFVKNREDEIFKLIFTDFGGQANGNYTFTQEKIETSSIKGYETGNFVIEIFPNPINSNNSLNLIINSGDDAFISNYSIYSTDGRLVKNENLKINNGLNTQTISLNNIQPGLYNVVVQIGNSMVNKKLIIK